MNNKDINKQHNYCLIVTYDCNWDCSFCITDTHSQPTISFEKLKSKITEIRPHSDVSLSGGEPGLVSTEKMRYILDELKKKDCDISVNTNGLFFEKHPEFIKDVDYFYFHCTEDLDISKGINLEGVPFDKTGFMMVLTDDNHHNLEWFLDKYPDIEFKVTAADPTIVRGKIGTKLSKINGIRIWHKFKDRISSSSMIFLLEKCQTINYDLERV